MRLGYWDNNLGIDDWRLAVLECLGVDAPVEVEFLRPQDCLDYNPGDALYDAVLKLPVQQDQEVGDVEFRGFVEAEGGPPLRELQPLLHIRPRPPPTPATWYARLQAGDYANMRDEELCAWFLVRVVGIDRRGTEPMATVV
jgi:hypothetical protein